MRPYTTNLLVMALLSSLWGLTGCQSRDGGPASSKKVEAPPLPGAPNVTGQTYTLGSPPVHVSGEPGRILSSPVYVPETRVVAPAPPVLHQPIVAPTPVATPVYTAEPLRIEAVPAPIQVTPPVAIVENPRPVPPDFPRLETSDALKQADKAMEGLRQQKAIKEAIEGGPVRRIMRDLPPPSPPPPAVPSIRR